MNILKSFLISFCFFQLQAAQFTKHRAKIYSVLQTYHTPSARNICSTNMLCNAKPIAIFSQSTKPLKMNPNSSVKRNSSENARYTIADNTPDWARSGAARAVPSDLYTFKPFNYFYAFKDKAFDKENKIQYTFIGSYEPCDEVLKDTDSKRTTNNIEQEDINILFERLPHNVQSKLKKSMNHHARHLTNGKVVINHLASIQNMLEGLEKVSPSLKNFYSFCIQDLSTRGLLASSRIAISECFRTEYYGDNTIEMFKLDLTAEEGFLSSLLALCTGKEISSKQSNTQSLSDDTILLPSSNYYKKTENEKVHDTTMIKQLLALPDHANYIEIKRAYFKARLEAEKSNNTERLEQLKTAFERLSCSQNDS